MATLRLYAGAHATMDNEPLQIGSRTEPVEITVDGDRFDVARTVADNYNLETLWSSGDGGLTTFNFLWFESDADVLLEFKDGADVWTQQVKAGVPLVLSSEKVYASALVDTTETTPLGAINTINVQNNVADNEGDARVRLILVN